MITISGRTRDPMPHACLGPINYSTRVSGLVDSLAFKYLHLYAVNFEKKTSKGSIERKYYMCVCACLKQQPRGLYTCSVRVYNIV